MKHSDPTIMAEEFRKSIDKSYIKISEVFDRYSDFVDSVALWKDSAYVILSMVEEAMEYQQATKLVKQNYRGDELTQEQQNFRLLNTGKELGDIFFFWITNCRLWGFDPLEIIKANVNKLESRAARNVIKGDGDVR